MLKGHAVFLTMYVVRIVNTLDTAWREKGLLHPEFQADLDRLEGSISTFRKLILGTQNK